MTNKELLISHINLLSEEDIASLLDAVILMETKCTLAPKPDCPYCGSHAIIRYGHKCGKQRFLCKSCAKTFLPTTHTIMSNSHFPPEIWREVIKDTIHGNAIDYTVQITGCSHQAVFDMRHKILMSLQQLPAISSVCLGGVSEFDETFVLDCYKGKEFDVSAPRKPRKHGAKPGVAELISIFDGHIADGTLALCDGLRSYHAFPGIADCTVKDCNNRSAEDACFYNLNTVNRLHSFIKQRYVFYRGVASKTSTGITLFLHPPTGMPKISSDG